MSEDNRKCITDLGRKLWECRKRIVASGQKLLDWDEVSKEVKNRRCGELDEGKSDE